MGQWLIEPKENIWTYIATTMKDDTYNLSWLNFCQLELGESLTSVNIILKIRPGMSDVREKRRRTNRDQNEGRDKQGYLQTADPIGRIRR